jgi:hypothetical protein
MRITEEMLLCYISFLKNILSSYKNVNYYGTKCVIHLLI